MNRTLAWNDLQVALAIAEAGTLSGAGRRLGLSHATVFRRLGDIERRLGARLFERARTGYTPTPAGEEVAAAARRVEGEVLTAERRVAGRDLRPSGTVRVTTTDTLLAGLLSPMLVAFRTSYPDIRLEVAVSNQLFSLSRREADVAIRPSSAPPETLVGRRVATIAQAVYVARERIAPDAAPRDTEVREWGGREWDTLEWIAPDEGMAYRALETWMAEQGLSAHCRHWVDSLFGMYAAARDGGGAAVLPCYLGDGDPRLVRAGAPIPALATELWLLTHPDLRRVARIRAFMDFLAAALATAGARLAGTP